MSSGIKQTEACLKAFTALKMQKLHSFVIFKITNDSRYIDVVYQGKPGLCYTDKEGFYDYAFENKEEGPFYAILDFKEKPADTGTILFIKFCLDSCKVREKMLYASSLETFKRCLEGITACHSISDMPELELESIKEAIAKKR